MAFGVVRHHLRLQCTADEAWSLAGDPSRLHEWFPGIVACVVDGSTRTITLATGIEMPEDIVVHDDVLRRFQYRITAPMFVFHRGTIDVLDLGDDTCVVIYTTEAEPRMMALTIGAATAAALEHLQQQLSTSSSTPSPRAP